MSSAPLTIHPVGIIHSPYREKFAVPRQPGLVTSLPAQLELLPPYNDPHCVRDLEQFSHLWLLFHFDQNNSSEWHPTVRPPRLGGNQRVGVFASRSPFRPNPIGLSVVELKRVCHENGRLWLELMGVDLVDQTPVFDIKPYIPFVDSIPDARSGFAPEPPVLMPVEIHDSIQAEIERIDIEQPGFRLFLQQVIAQDPRPAYRKDEDGDRIYGVRLLTFNINWQVIEGVAIICGISASA